MDWIYLAQGGGGLVNGNELSSSIKGREIRDYVRDSQLLKKDSAPLS